MNYLARPDSKNETVRLSECFEVFVCNTSFSGNNTTVTVKVRVLHQCPGIIYDYLSDEIGINENGELIKSWTSTATCDSRDKFDTKIGTEIASHKAMANAYNFMYHRIFDIKHALLSAFGDLTLFANKTFKHYTCQLHAINRYDD